jgi:hypothetical protein
MGIQVSEQIRRGSVGEVTGLVALVGAVAALLPGER